MNNVKRIMRRNRNRITAEKIHSYSKELFAKYKYGTLVPKVEDKNKWGDYIADKLKLDKIILWELNSEFFWALANTEISLGYTLIARETCEFPRGKKTIGYDPDDIPTNFTVQEMHFWYHVNNTRECIYRCWERISNVLTYVCYPENSENYYYNTIVEKISKDRKYKTNSNISQLKKQIKYWTKDSGSRNSLSHKASSPFIKDKLEFDIPHLYNGQNELVFKITAHNPNLIQEIETAKDSYMRISKVWLAVKEFIESLIKDENV